MPQILVRAVLVACAMAIAIPAHAASKKSRVNPFETGFIAGAATHRDKNPRVLGPKGLARATPSGTTAKAARISFKRIEGGLDYHQALINKLVPQMVKRNKVKVVGLKQNPTHIVTGRIISNLDPTGATVSYRWHIRDANGKKLQYFVDTERGNKVRFTGWHGISHIEMKKVSKTAADRLVYWLNNGS